MRENAQPLTAHSQNLGFVWKVGHFVFWVTFVKYEAKRIQKPKLRLMREPLPASVTKRTNDKFID